MQQQVAVGGAISATGPRAVMAAVIGNGLEWYNFMLYGVFASIIAKLYFPTANALTSLLLSLGTFAVGFFMRPLGAAVLGAYSDRNGRKAALSLTIMLMCIGTAMIALLPTFAQIGLAAPILLMVARLMQGFSTGGEMGNATAFMREYAPEGRTGYYVSWVYASSSLFIALGSAVGTVVSRGFSPEALETWGWRVPFLLGLLIGPVGYVLRTRIADPPHRHAVSRCRHQTSEGGVCVGRVDHALHHLHLHAADLYAGLCRAGAAFAAIRRFHRDDGGYRHGRRSDPRVRTLRR